MSLSRQPFTKQLVRGPTANLSKAARLIPLPEQTIPYALRVCRSPRATHPTFLTYCLVEANLTTKA